MSRPAPDLVARLLHRDGLLLIIDKPAGWAVHAAPGVGDPLDQHFEQLRFGLKRDPVLAHRLDKETTGCLVLGRHPKATRKLADLFKAKRVEKTYLAIVDGVPETEDGVIDAPLLRVDEGNRAVMRPDAIGQPSETRWKRLSGDGARTLVEAKPTTGRMHQIRVHLASIGLPIVGDRLYGDAGSKNGLMLHAVKIRVPMQASKPPVEAVAPIPDAFGEMVKSFHPPLTLFD